MILGRVVCFFKGHKRGKFVPQVGDFYNPNEKLFKCPRCGHETRYKVKPS